MDEKVIFTKKREKVRYKLMKKAEEIYKKLNEMNLSMLARSVINSSDQYGILIFEGLDEVDVEMLCEEISNDDL